MLLKNVFWRSHSEQTVDSRFASWVAETFIATTFICSAMQPVTPLYSIRPFLCSTIVYATLATPTSRCQRDEKKTRAQLKGRKKTTEKEARSLMTPKKLCKTASRTAALADGRYVI
jgi:hypothetical protein